MPSFAAPPVIPGKKGGPVPVGGQVDLSGRSNVNTGVVGPGVQPRLTPQERQRQINQGVVDQRKANRQKKLAAMAAQAKTAGQKRAMQRPMAPPLPPSPVGAPAEPLVLTGRNQGENRY